MKFGPTKHSRVDGEVHFTKYYDGHIAIEKHYNGESELRATANIPEAHLNEDCVWAKDWSENAGVADALEKSGIATRTGRQVGINYVHAIEMKLTPAAIAAIKEQVS